MLTQTVPTLFFLLVVFQLKHFLADYPWQTDYMLGKFKADWNFMPHLMAHAGVHALCTFAIVWWSGETPATLFELAVKLATFDFAVHFLMDRVKASPGMLGRFKTLSGEQYQKAKEGLASWQGYCPWNHKDRKALRHNKYFWWALGLDQMVHHLTHYTIIYFVFEALR